MNNKAFFKKVAKDIVDDELSASFCGTQKKCIVVGNRVFLVIDIEGMKHSQETFLEKRQEYIQKVNQLSEKVNTPKILENGIFGNLYIEMQERAPGEYVGVFVENEIIKLISEDNSNMSFDTMSNYTKLQLGQVLFEKNARIQKTIKFAENVEFEKMLKNIKQIYSAGFAIDLTGQNVLYDTKTGFHFIDLDEIPKNSNFQDRDVLFCALAIFSAFGKYTSSMSPENGKIIAKNNAALIRSVFGAAKFLNISKKDFEALKKFAENFCMGLKLNNFDQDQK